MESVKNISLLSILLIALVSMILVPSQLPVAFAGIGDDHDADGDGYNPKQGDCDDNNPDVYPGHGCDPAEDVLDLIDDIEEMLEDGDFDINNGQTNSILTKLGKAIDKIESENTNAAIGSLNAFINQINAFINSGSISPEDGQTLIDGAQSIIDSL